MRTYWHIAGSEYEVGDDLLSRDEQEARGYELAPWKWDDAEEGFDGDVVCLFETREEAEAFRQDLYPGRPLRVDLPEDVRVRRVSEGYPAVARRIPAEFITEEESW